MSANVGTLGTGAARLPTRWKAALIGLLMVAALTVGAIVLTKTSAPATSVSPNVTSYVLPPVAQTGRQFTSTSSRHPEHARRKFGGVPASQGHAKGPFVRRKGGW